MGSDIHHPGILAQLVGYHLRRASAVVATDFKETLEGTGVRQVLFGILSLVVEYPGISQGVVGQYLGVQRANMVALVNELVGRDLVARGTDPFDKRAVALTVTEAGHALFRDCLDKIVEHEEKLLSDFSDAERATLLSLLNRIEKRGE